MRLLEEANSCSYLTISISSDYDAHEICSSFLVLGQPPRNLDVCYHTSAGTRTTKQINNHITQDEGIISCKLLKFL